MTNERKAELFDGAMNWVFSNMVYGDAADVVETLDDIGYTDEEIEEVLANSIFAEDEE